MPKITQKQLDQLLYAKEVLTRKPEKVSTLGQRLAEVRNRKGIKTLVLSRMTFERNIKEGIAYTTLYYIESGRIKNARADQLVKICLTLGCTPEEFLYIAGYPQK